MTNEKEDEALDQLRIARRDSGGLSAAAWVHVGEFLVESDLERWFGVTPKACFSSALKLLPKGTHDPFRADALLGLGTLLTDEGHGYRDPVLEEAIAHLSEAIRIFERIQDDEGELEARYYRAYAWTELVGPQRRASAEQALQELNLIRNLVRADGDPIWVANIDFLIGNAFLERVEGDPRKNNDEAEKAFKSGLRVFSRAKNQNGLAQGYLNLAVTYNERQRMGDLGAGTKAIKFARSAWRNCTEDVPVELRTSILSNLANALAERGGRQWVANTRKAEKILTQGIELSDTVGSPGGQVMRLVRSSLVLGLVQYVGDDRMADVMADLDACIDVFDPADTTQWWLEWMELRTLAAAVRDEPAEMIRLAEKALDQSENILIRTETFSEKSHLLSQLALIADLGVLGHLKVGGPVDGLMFARRVYGRMLGFDSAMYEQPDGIAELYLLNPSTEDWTGVLLAAGINCDLYPLEGIGKDFWSNAIAGLEEGYFSGLDDLRNLHGTKRFSESLDEWIVKISGALGPVLFDLREEGFSEIVVFAFGGWCTVPIAALQMPGSEPTQLIDHAAIAYGPDQHQARPISWAQVLHVLDAGLEEAAAEREMLENLANATTVCSTLVEVQRALSSGEPFNIIHFTTHGAHDFDYLEGAGIRCADGGLLTARWVFENARLTKKPLICLAACQTGLADFSNLPHETFGLPTAFLSARAGSVISSQWPIDDVATRLIMTRVYQNLKLGTSVSEALREAQRWLRDADETSVGAASTGATRFTTFDADGDDAETPPFSDPYFWSGFLLHRA